ncbi:alpha/beta fold hydrolase [Pseudarthrobacter raffinosi]|uniref:alpha/beta fold hydrolase n=1 Tax=Pseudarthrobacter raffinosi TaxID=2953651 RepID=UPI00208F4225|nr:alpha/beta hydrolase [Pseudarthrobacter sp. MDT3-9]MCO4252123.1 alpha/beta hydrolase [Pseudarthrobacter sp. MDT3-9]
MQTFRTADSRTLSYTLKGAGPLVVLLPGGPGLDPEIYFGGLDLPGYQLLIFNPRGTGASDPPAAPDGYRLAGYVEDVEALHRHLGQKRLCIYGSSHGATTALAYATAYPGNVNSLILASGPARMDETFIRELEKIHQAFELSVPDGTSRLNGSRQAGPRMRSASTDQDRRTAMRTMMDTYIARPSPEDRAFLDRLATAPLNFAAPATMAAEMSAGLDLLSEAPKVTARTLVLGGDLDVRVPPQHLEQIVEAIPGARLHRFPESGHLLHIEAPQEWAEVVTGFLNEGDFSTSNH